MTMLDISTGNHKWLIIITISPVAQCTQIPNDASPPEVQPSLSILAKKAQIPITPPVNSLDSYK